MVRRHAHIISLIALTASVSGFTGYSYGLKQSPPAYNQPQISSVQKPADLKLGPATIVKSQQAQATGEITSVEDDSILVKSNGDQTKFKLASSFFVYPLSTDPKRPPQPKREKSAIEINKQANISLELNGTEYQVVSIAYLK